MDPATRERLIAALRSDPRMEGTSFHRANPEGVADLVAEVLAAEPEHRLLTKAYVVCTGTPGPGVEALIGEALEGTDDFTPLGEVLGKIMAAARKACEFVESELEDGRGIGASAGLEWTEMPVAEGEHAPPGGRSPFWRLGPFYVRAPRAQLEPARLLPVRESIDLLAGHAASNGGSISEALKAELDAREERAQLADAPERLPDEGEDEYNARKARLEARRLEERRAATDPEDAREQAMAKATAVWGER